MRTPALASVALLAAAALLLPGCASAPPKPAGEPSLLKQDLQVASQDLTQVALRLQGELSHPSAATLESAQWELVSDGQVVQRGESALGTPLAPGAPTPFSFEVARPYVQSAEALRALSQKQGSLLLALRGTLRVRPTGAESAQSVDFAASRAVRMPHLPAVRVERLDAARYGPEELTLTVGLGVDTPNPFPLRLSGLKWALGVKGKGLAEGNALRRDSVGPASTAVYDVEASVTKESYGPDVATLLRSATLPYTLEGTLEGEGFSIPFSLTGEVNLGRSR